MKKEQILSFYPLMDLEYVDHKIKEIGKVWRSVTVISLEYFGGAYDLTLLAKELKRENGSL